MKRMIKYIALMLAVFLTLPLYGCGAPELSEVKDDFISLIEGSHEINEIFFGAGLETYERDSAYAIENQIYYDLSESYDFYEIVIINEKFYDISSIKNAAEAIYTADYLEGIYTMAFDGIADNVTGEITTARYLDSELCLLRYAYGEKDSFDFLMGKNRKYLYDTMEITRGNARAVNVSIDSYLEGEESEILNVRLRFVKQNGEWRLDTPTY